MKNFDCCLNTKGKKSCEFLIAKQKNKNKKIGEK